MEVNVDGIIIKYDEDRNLWVIDSETENPRTYKSLREAKLSIHKMNHGVPIYVWRPLMGDYSKMEQFEFLEKINPDIIKVLDKEGKVRNISSKNVFANTKSNQNLFHLIAVAQANKREWHVKEKSFIFELERGVR